MVLIEIIIIICDNANLLWKPVTTIMGHFAVWKSKQKVKTSQWVSLEFVLRSPFL